jgi:predicted PurR-regulated permease PerM
VNPWYSLWFLVFTLILQTCDGYILKPKLFGETLGVSSLWILVCIIAGGRMFGVIGILLAIPIAAIIDFIFREYLIPYLKNRKTNQ